MAIGKNKQKLVKSSYVLDNMSPKDLEEFKKCYEDPIYFIKNYCYIQHPVKGKLRFTLYDYQEELIQLYHGYRQSISLLPRQCGKTACAAAYLLWYAIFINDSYIIIASNKHKGAKDIIRRIKYMYENCPDFIRAGVDIYNVNSIYFDNGSIIEAEATTENTARGLSISVLYLDEFAFVRENVAVEFWTSLSPTLSTGGKCLITSTPDVDDNMFATIWKNSNITTDEYGNENPDGVGINEFKSYSVHWSRHPDRDEKWAKTERAKIGEEKFLREFECQFVAFDETLVDSVFLSRMKSINPKFKTGNVRWFVDKLLDNKTYLISLDPSVGTGGDDAAMHIFMLPDFIQVGEWMHNKTTMNKQIEIIKDISDYIHEETIDTEIMWSFENNSIGEAIVSLVYELGEEYINANLITKTGKGNKKFRKGFNTTNSEKIKACNKLKLLIESERIVINSESMLRQLKTFISHGNSYKAKPGSKDDLVMSLLIIIRMIEYVSGYDESINMNFKENFEFLENDNLNDEYGLIFSRHNTYI